MSDVPKAPGRELKESAANVLDLSGSATGTKVWPWIRLLKSAEELLDVGFPAAAVVVAVTACETIVARAITLGFQRKKVPELEATFDQFINNYNLANDRVRMLYTALTSDSAIHDDQPLWEKFKKAVSCRNDVVHKGIHVEQEDAKQHIEVVERVVRHVEAVKTIPDVKPPSDA